MSTTVLVTDDTMSTTVLVTGDPDFNQMLVAAAVKAATELKTGEPTTKESDAGTDNVTYFRAQSEHLKRSQQTWENEPPFRH